MLEIPIASCTAQTEEQRRIALQYSIIVETTPKGLSNYGVKIMVSEANNCAIALGVTMSTERIQDLIDLLIHHIVIPADLIDILADWL